MSVAVNTSQFPRGALLGAGALVVFALCLAVVGRMTGIGTTRAPVLAVVETRELRFSDRDDGAIEVRDAQTGRIVSVLAPGQDGFVRVVMRSLARERKLREVGAEPPFRLTRAASGSLFIEDPATGQHVHLVAFGAENAAAFARLLNTGSATP